MMIIKEETTADTPVKTVDPRGTVSGYALRENGAAVTVGFLLGDYSPLPDISGITNIQVFTQSNGKIQFMQAYDVALSESGLTLAPVSASAAAAPTGEESTEARGTYAEIDIGNGGGSYFIGFNGHTLVIYPIDDGAKNQLADKSGGRKVVAMSIVSAVKDLQLTPGQVKAVKIFLD